MWSRRTRRAPPRSRARARPSARPIQRRSTRSAAQPVTSVSRNKRHELDEADDPEPQRGFLEAHRVAGDVVDLPADDDDHRHLGDRRGQPGQPEIAERRDLERFGEEAHAGAPSQRAAGRGNRRSCRRVANRLISHGMVRPWTRIEKATTTKAVTMIALRSGTLDGTASASASASAPRSPPQNKVCW